VGEVQKTSREVSETYFHSRPRGSQLSAAASRQSFEVASRQDLDAAKSQLTEQFDGQPVPLPNNWGGYLLRPNRIEFWQGRLDRLHDRIEYRFGNEWTWIRLSP
jgi:pyridoxamine 5'-phosphate oxidase